MNFSSPKNFAVKGDQMAQLAMKTGIVDSPLLRRHIASNVEEIETLLPEGAPLTVYLNRVSKHLFGAQFRARLQGRLIVVRAYDANLFHALSRARRGIVRHIDDARGLQRDEVRQRRAR